MSILNTKIIHFIGAGGIGVSALAKLFLAEKATVSASDRVSSPILRDLESRGATIFVGHTKENLPTSVDLVVYSSAVPDINPEIVLAREKGVPTYSYPEALGEMMKSYRGVAVSGTHGKTTTTSMLGKLLLSGGVDPLVIVGGKVPGFDGNLRLEEKRGEEKVFLVEACEYRRNMLQLSPEIIVLTNIEADHLDYYRDLEDVKDAFVEFVSGIPNGGKLIWNADDEICSQVAANISSEKSVSYSLNKEADLMAYDLSPVKREGTQGTQFSMRWKGEEFGDFFLPVPGIFNVANALAATACAVHLGVSVEAVRQGLVEFHGTWRRFQKMGERDGVVVYSDYAHHPTAVKNTIEAAKEIYPQKKVLVVFQPHQRNRTKAFFHEFVGAFDAADGVLLSEIYDVAGREQGESMSSKELVDDISKRTEKSVIFAASLEETETKILELFDQYDVVLILGAGDIHQVAESLVLDTKGERILTFQ